MYMLMLLSCMFIQVDIPLHSFFLLLYFNYTQRNELQGHNVFDQCVSHSIRQSWVFCHHNSSKTT